MKFVHIVLAFGAVSPAAMANQFSTMYYPSATVASPPELPTCTLKANNLPCTARSPTPANQTHIVSTFNLPLLPALAPNIPGKGSRCFRMQHASSKPIEDHDANLCLTDRACDSVPLASLWMTNDECFTRGPFRAVMAFTGKSCDGEWTWWDMQYMRDFKHLDVVRTNAFATDNWCVQMFNRADGPKIASFQFLTEVPPQGINKS